MNPIPDGVSPFLWKLYHIINSSSSLSSWSEPGSSFIVWNTEEFAKQVLPEHFKHSNMCSFVRQLNKYGFKKIHAQRFEFAHPHFQRGKQNLLCNIVTHNVRKKRFEEEEQKEKRNSKRMKNEESAGDEEKILVDASSPEPCSSNSCSSETDNSNGLKRPANLSRSVLGAAMELPSFPNVPPTVTSLISTRLALWLRRDAQLHTIFDAHMRELGSLLKESGAETSPLSIPTVTSIQTVPILPYQMDTELIIAEMNMGMCPPQDYVNLPIS